jgi:hypothetical protein
MKKPITRNTVFFAAGGFAAALFLAGAAHAITDTVFRYSSPKQGYVSFDPMAFTPQSNNDASDYSLGWVSNFGITTGSNMCFNTGVNLPQGATITGLTIWERSTVANISPAITFKRRSVVTGVVEVIGIKDFTDTSGTRKALNVTISSAMNVVDNSRYTYGLGGCINSTMNFYGARIAYTYVSAGD